MDTAKDGPTLRKERSHDERVHSYEREKGLDPERIAYRIEER